MPKFKNDAIAAASLLKKATLHWKEFIKYAKSFDKYASRLDKKLETARRSVMAKDGAVDTLVDGGTTDFGRIMLEPDGAPELVEAKRVVNDYLRLDAKLAKAKATDKALAKALKKAAKDEAARILAEAEASLTELDNRLDAVHVQLGAVQQSLPFGETENAEKRQDGAAEGLTPAGS